MDAYPDDFRKSTIVAAPPAAVWAAIADSAAFGSWFNCRFDGPFVEGQFTDGEITELGHEGLKFWIKVEEMVPPYRFSFRWPYEDGEEAHDLSKTTIVIFNLAPEGEGTVVTITEAGFAAMPEDMALSKKRDNAEGWEIQLGRLTRHFLQGDIARAE